MALTDKDSNALQASGKKYRNLFKDSPPGISDPEDCPSAHLFTILLLILAIGTAQFIHADLNGVKFITGAILEAGRLREARDGNIGIPEKKGEPLHE